MYNVDTLSKLGKEEVPAAKEDDEANQPNNAPLALTAPPEASEPSSSSVAALPAPPEASAQPGVDVAALLADPAKNGRPTLPLLLLKFGADVAQRRMKSISFFVVLRGIHMSAYLLSLSAAHAIIAHLGKLSESGDANALQAAVNLRALLTLQLGYDPYNPPPFLHAVGQGNAQDLLKTVYVKDIANSVCCVLVDNSLPGPTMVQQLILCGSEPGGRGMGEPVCVTHPGSEDQCSQCEEREVSVLNHPLRLGTQTHFHLLH